MLERIQNLKIYVRQFVNWTWLKILFRSGHRLLQSYYWCMTEYLKWPYYLGDGEAHSSALNSNVTNHYKVFNIYIDSFVAYADNLSSNSPQRLTYMRWIQFTKIKLYSRCSFWANLFKVVPKFLLVNSVAFCFCFTFLKYYPFVLITGV